MQISEEVKKEEPVEKVEPETKKEEVPTKASISEKILQEEMSEKRVIVERFSLLFSLLIRKLVDGFPFSLYGLGSRRILKKCFKVRLCRICQPVLFVS